MRFVRHIANSTLPVYLEMDNATTVSVDSAVVEKYIEDSKGIAEARLPLPTINFATTKERHDKQRVKEVMDVGGAHKEDYCKI